MKYYYKNTEGEVVEFIPNEWNTLEQLKQYNPEYNIESNELEYFQFKGDDIKSRKKALINIRTDELIAQGIDHNGVHFDMKPEDQANINTLFNLKNNGLSMAGQYFRASGQDYTFADDADFLALVQTALTTVQGHIQNGAALKNQVDAATTIAEVEAVEDLR